VSSLSTAAPVAGLEPVAFGVLMAGGEVVLTAGFDIWFCKLAYNELPTIANAISKTSENLLPLCSIATLKVTHTQKLFKALVSTIKTYVFFADAV
jgi:hypothetical protein